MLSGLGSSNPNDHGKLKKNKNKMQAKIFHITRKNVSMFSLTEGWLLYLVGCVKELINNSTLRVIDALDYTLYM